MKDTKIDNLQLERGHWRYNANKSQTHENWTTYRENRNEIKENEDVTEKETFFLKNFIIKSYTVFLTQT